MIIVNRRSAKVNWVLLLILLACSAMPKIRICSYISILVWIGYMLRLIKDHKLVLLKYFSFIFLANIGIVSVIICEFANNLYLNELGTYTGFVGAIPLYILSNYLFVFVLSYKEERKKSIKIFYEKKANIISQDRNIYSLRLITFIVLALYLIIFIKIFPHPAFLLNVDRMFYSENYAPGGIFKIIEHQVVLLVTFPVLLFIKSKRFTKDQYLATITIVIYCLYYLWNGNKFGPFFTLFSLFLVFYSKKIAGLDKKIIKKIMFFSIMIIIILLSIAVLIQTSISNIDAFSYLSQRLAQQGQLWWRTYSVSEMMHPREFLNEITAIIHGRLDTSECVGANFGIYKIMYLCAPKSWVDYKLSHGARYTQAGYACAFYYFGLMGTLFYSLFTALLIYKLVNALLKNHSNGDYIKVLLLMRLYINANTAISMFLYYELLDMISIISYFYLLLFSKKKLVIKKERKFWSYKPIDH